MKKFLMVVSMVVMTAAGLYAATQNFDGAGAPPFLSLQGGMLFPGSAISYGKNPGDQTGTAFPCSADVAITAGDVVILSSGTTYFMSVTKTTTAGSVSAFGIAMNTVTAAGQTVYVRTRGLIRAKNAVAVVKGDILITSATAGSLTLTTAVTVDSYTAVSQNAFVAIAAETSTTSGFVTVYVTGR